MSFLVDRKDILEWSDEVRAGFDLPRLLRSLISHDNSSISRLYMPANEGARLPGYDGEVEASEPSVLVPAGLSVWELGVEANPASKATKDYKKRTASPGSLIPSKTTYIAVTSRSWPKRGRWAADRRAESVWRDVKAYDVEDLSAALDRDTPSTVLFRDLTDRRGGHATTLMQWWADYRRSFTVGLEPEFVLAGRSSQVAALKAWRAGEGSSIDLRAQSHEDGRAFVASAFDDESKSESSLIVCDDVGSARELLGRSRQPIVLVTTIDSSELAPLGVHRTIKINTSGRGTVELPRQSTRELRELLKASGVEQDEADNYAVAARRSLYRYRLVSNQNSHPQWSEEFQDRQFRRLWLIGGWERNNEGSEFLLRTELDMEVADAAGQVSRDVNSADPIFSHVGDVWSVIEPLASARYLAERSDLVSGDLAAFRPIALSVLGEIDPALKLPDGERWLASIKGKTRRYTERTRRSIASTLAVLASECGADPLSRGMTIQDWTDQLVWELLQGWDDVPSMWVSLGDVLTLLVEAAPEVILDQIHRNLLTEHGNLQVLSAPEQSPFNLGSSSCITTILWSLRSLMWSPEYCEQALDTVRDLARYVEEDNCKSTAIRIIREALSPAMPQCALDTAGRVTAIERCVRDAPAVARRIIEESITTSCDSVTVCRARFRPWGTEQRVTWADAYEVYTTMINGAIALTDQFPDLWVTLVDAVDDVGSRGFNQIITALEILPTTHPVSTSVWQAAQGQLRRHRNSQDSNWALPDAYLTRLEAAVNHLKPALARKREEWLFGNKFKLGLAAADMSGEDSPLLRMQANAVRNILAEEGFEGLLELARTYPQAAWDVGAALVLSSYEPGLIAMAELLKSDDPGVGDLVRGYFVNSVASGKTNVLQLTDSFPDDPMVQARLLLTHHDLPEAWEYAEQIGQQVSRIFWTEFRIYGRGADFPHAESIIRKLLEHGRTATALNATALYMEAIPSESRSNLILEGFAHLVSKAAVESFDWRSIDMIPELIATVRNDISVDRATVYQLEWFFYPLLEGEEGEPLAIEVAASTSAEDFVHLVNLAYSPKSVAKEAHVIDKRQARTAFHILDHMRYTPGPSGEEIDAKALTEWVQDVALLTTKSDCFDSAMCAVGAVLGRVNVRDGQPYPHPAIVAVLEGSIGDHALKAFGISIFNARGLTVRGHGGRQEYDLAEKYEAISRKLRDVAPRTSATFKQLGREYRRDGVREDEREQRIEEGIDIW